ncbi:MAG: hypothetical protein J3Q66DRAFT_107485 [Benniella sp.]|nr:MAG: hypothetical protein J3Q66DRAFT_107485 [Benniella sp.]
MKKICSPAHLVSPLLPSILFRSLSAHCTSHTHTTLHLAAILLSLSLLLSHLPLLPSPSTHSSSPPSCTYIPRARLRRLFLLLARLLSAPTHTHTLSPLFLLPPPPPPPPSPPPSPHSLRRSVSLSPQRWSLLSKHTHTLSRSLSLSLRPYIHTYIHTTHTLSHLSQLVLYNPRLPSPLLH